MNKKGNRMKEHVKNKRFMNIILTVAVFILGLMICCGYVTGHYSADDYNIMNKGYNEYSIVNNLKEGRPIMFVIDQAALAINMSYDVFIILTVIIAIFFTSINVVMIYNQFISNISIHSKTIKLLLLMTVFSTIFCFTYIENLYFVESIVMAMSLVCYTIAAKHIVATGKKNLLIGALWATLAMFLYNGFECYFVTIIVLFSMLNHKDERSERDKTIIKNILIAAGIILVTVVFNMIQIKLACMKFHIENNRVGGLSQICGNAIYILSYFPEIVTDTMGLFPKYLYAGILCALCTVSLINAIIHKNYESIANIIILLPISILSCFAVSFVSLSSFGTGRLCYGIGMAIGLALLVPFIDSFWKEKTIFTYVWIFFAIAYFMGNAYNYMDIIHSHKQVNMLEKEEISQIQQLVRNYEAENNVTVKYLSIVCRDYTKGKYYPQVKRKCGVTVKGTACEWSCLGTIHYYSDLRLTKAKLTSQQLEDYKKRNTITPYCIDNRLVCTAFDW